MRVATVNTTTCPRCDAPVKGDFQYCPECAYRLHATALPPDEPPPAGGRSGCLLLGLGAVALLAAGYLVGVRILGPNAPPAYEPPPQSKALTVADIQDQMVEIPAGTADYSREMVYDVPPGDEVVRKMWRKFAAGQPLVVVGNPDAENPGSDESDPRDRPIVLEDLLQRPRALDEWNQKVEAHYRDTESEVEPKEVLLPVRTRPFLIMKHELSRGQYAEFLTAVQEAPEVLAREDFVCNLLWRPPPGDLPRRKYAKHYRDQWWLRIAARYRDEEDREAPRPDWMDQVALSDEQGAWLLIPPSWVRVDPYGSLSWELEPGTEDLPVTGISWWDAHMFVVWARQALGLEGLAMPNGLQWMRAFHGGHPEKLPDDFDEDGAVGRRWPWGNTSDPNGCNCANFPLNETTPVLRHVFRRYNWHEGKTAEGVLNMAGNAAEWVDNWVIELPPTLTGADYRIYSYEYLDPERLILNQKAYAAGGSYLAGIGDCGLPLNKVLDKCAREVHVGVRLIMTRLGP